MLPEVVWIFTTPIAVPDILAMVQAIPDPRWRFAFQLLCAFGLRPEELQHLQLRQGRLCGARMKRLSLAAKPSPGPSGSCPVTNGPRNGDSSKPLIRQSSRPCELAKARIPSVATCCGETTGKACASSTKPRENSWCSIPAGTVMPTGPT